jgi:BNR repeat-like domain
MLYVVVLALGVPAASEAAPTATVNAISHGSPFPHECGYHYRAIAGAAGEPQIAINPTNRRNILVFHQQDRRPGNVGGAVANVIRVSRDGGRTWRLVLIPGTTRCSGGPLDAASDPWISFGPDGIAYEIQNTYVLRPPPLQKAFGSAVGIRTSVSRDGGRHWSSPVVLASDSPTTTTDADKPSVIANPRRPGVAYATWFESTLKSSSVMFAQTTDAGRDWSSPSAIYTIPSTFSSAFAWGSQIAPLRHGVLVASFEVGPLPNDRNEILVTRSTDRGRTWSTPRLIGTVRNREPFDPDTHQTVRTVPGGPSIAADAAGVVYIAYGNIRNAHHGPILLSRSANGGRTFTRPRAIVTGATQHFTPTIAARPNGVLGLSFYDFRGDRPHDHKLTTAYWFAVSRDHGRAWQRLRLGRPFDALTAPVASRGSGPSGHFLGEYQGLASVPGGFDAAFTLARPATHHGPSDIFFAHITG